MFHLGSLFLWILVNERLIVPLIDRMLVYVCFALFRVVFDYPVTLDRAREIVCGDVPFHLAYTVSLVLPHQWLFKIFGLETC